ncbi:sigma-70 family RNA polymerase sigma factor [Bacillus sp. BHET2]|uniref:sigma-70 family RNA polymerase sigma factor n=1 Tax=Bacillus sp. BHET2 TaxID=2583818 RepID=UPI00110E3704|nr:sigma-70 family RNA polymerase sigma factor [Bacillus sp. BHET2]TMU87516.1 sigma-70 family RNA polymerase sigma factor [Bacillus sp. BHET2]
MESFEELQKNYELMIHKLIHTLHIYKNKDEYYQTGLIALWEAYENFDAEKGAFPAYAYYFVRGRILSQLTSENRNETKSIFKETDFFEVIEDENGNEQLAQEMVLSYCEDLTENQKKWVMYTCVHMLTISEIAEVENVSNSAVKKWRKGAKDKIKESLVIREN